MSKAKLNQLTITTSIIKEVEKGLKTTREGATVLSLSSRQLRRKRRSYEKDGTIGLIHKNSGRKSNRALAENVAEKIITLAREEYAGYGPTLIAEYLRIDHSIIVHSETVRRLLITSGQHKPKKKRQRKEHPWRERMSNPGMLVLIDGSLHQWFNETYCTLMLAVDDATSEIYAEFVPESFKGVASFFNHYIQRYGRPLKVYVDRGSVYKVTKSNEDNTYITQFHRCLKELDIELIFARSPQAKGRVERPFRTLQKRLCIELRRAGVATIEQAAPILKKFITTYNTRWTVVPEKPTTLARSIKDFDLPNIFCEKHQRKVLNGRILKFENQRFLIEQYYQPHLIKIGVTLTVHRYFNDSIKITSKGKDVHYRLIKPEQKVSDVSVKTVYDDLRPWDISVRRTFL